MSSWLYHKTIKKNRKLLVERIRALLPNQLKNSCNVKQLLLADIFLQNFSRFLLQNILTRKNVLIFYWFWSLLEMHLDNYYIWKSFLFVDISEHWIINHGNLVERSLEGMFKNLLFFFRFQYFHQIDTLKKGPFLEWPHHCLKLIAKWPSLPPTNCNCQKDWVIRIIIEQIQIFLYCTWWKSDFNYDDNRLQGQVIIGENDLMLPERENWFLDFTYRGK